MENYTEGLPLWQWAKHKTCEELANVEWLQKIAEETPLDELEKYNPAVTSFLNLIADLEKNQTARNKEELQFFKKILLREKVMAIVHRDEKMAKEVA